MPRSIWKGSINFGLVNIPVSLYAAEERNELSFRMLDRRNLAPVKYQRVNEKSGREVPWDEIVKGYEYEPDQYVVLADQELKRANVEATQTVEITGFVDGSEISPVYYDKPYYLEPLKKARKSYALLREVLKRTGKVGIGKIVIRSKQYLAAVIARGPVIIVGLLRYEHELRKPDELDLPQETLKELGIGDREIKLAERLVEAMIEPWKPEQYADTYRDDVMALIEDKIKAGVTDKVLPAPAEAAPRRKAQVIDIMDLLKRSVEKAKKEEAPARKRHEGRRKAG
jgi:DNA end-binding protein Ku